MLRTDTWPNDKQAHIDDHRAMHKRYNAEYSAADYGSIQAAIDAAQAAGGGCVFVPPGEYRIAKALVISSGDVSLRGVGRVSHIVNDSAGYALSLTGQLGDAIRFLDVERLRFSGGAGIQAQYVIQVTLDRVDVDDQGGAAVSLDSVFHARLLNNELGGVALGAKVHHLAMVGNRIASRTAGVDVRGGRLIGGHIAGNTFEACQQAAIISGATTDLVLGLHVAGNYFEYNNHRAPGPHIDIGGNAQGIHVVGNYFQGNGTTSHAVLVQDGHDGFMAGNDCRGHSIRDVELTAGASRWVVYQRQGSGTLRPPLDAGEQNTLIDYQFT